MKLPMIYLARHGETEWSLTGQHTGLNDIPLTRRGEEDARKLGKRLGKLSFAHIMTSPLQRARRTCELAGFSEAATIDADLVEWDYGEYSGIRTDEIRQKRPDWKLFCDGCPGGESLAQIGARADRVVARLRELAGDVLLFSSGHFLRVLTARWLGLAATGGQYFTLNTATLSILGYERDLSEPVIRLWNDAHHLAEGS